MNYGSWGGTASIGGVYLLSDKQDLARAGHGWAKGQLQLGDLLLCEQHSGDCFYDYSLLTDLGLSPTGALTAKRMERPLGAYQLGTLLGTLSKAQMQTLARGDTAKLGNLRIEHLPGPAQARLEALQLRDATPEVATPGRKPRI